MAESWKSLLNINSRFVDQLCDDKSLGLCAHDLIFFTTELLLNSALLELICTHNLIFFTTELLLNSALLELIYFLNNVYNKTIITYVTLSGICITSHIFGLWSSVQTL